MEVELALIDGVLVVSLVEYNAEVQEVDEWTRDRWWEPKRKVAVLKSTRRKNIIDKVLVPGNAESIIDCMEEVRALCQRALSTENNG